MRDLPFFADVLDYNAHVRTLFDQEPLISKNRFYANLIQFILENRAPVFYRMSAPSENLSFDAAYNFVTIRDKFHSAESSSEHASLEVMAWIHDFTHMLFAYPMDVWMTSEEDFTRLLTYQERVASNETEILIYHRVPELREKVFKDETIYYDVIVKDPDRFPLLSSPTALWEHRNRLVEDDRYADEMLGDNPEILAYFRRWRVRLPDWINMRYRSVAGKRVPLLPGANWLWLQHDNYERYITHYHQIRTSDKQVHQDNYERYTLYHLQVAYALLGWDDSPQRWRHVPDALSSLEGAVLLPNP